MTSGLEMIRGRIMEKAKAEAGELIQAAAKERSDMITAAKEEAEMSASTILDDATREAEIRFEERLAAIRTDLKKKALVKREELINEAWTEAWKRMEAHVQTPEYREALLDLVVKTAQLVEEESFIVQANERDSQTIAELRPRIESCLAEDGFARSMEIGKRIECVGGIQVSDSERKVVFDRTYEAKARRLRSSLRSSLARILAEGSE